MKYRKEIDGLRAIAVIPVILFHAGFSTFSGGFVGVDVFFVNSGYLITTIILAEKEKGIFNLVNFYERRSRRIIPALFFVMFSSTLASWFWLYPVYMVDFSQSLIAVSLFSSNILFWQETGYWGVENELKPLLHTWSLAVEEQYYIFFPLFLMLMWRFRKRWIFTSFVLIALSSLLLSQYLGSVKPTANFFLLPTRGWELAVGAGIAFYFLYRSDEMATLLSHKFVDEMMGVLGILLIVFSVFFYNENTPFPGIYALVPTIGTALIIIFSNAKTYVGKALGSKLLVSIGLISYSAYLWHQPLFVFARHRSLTAPSTGLLILLSLASLCIAYISWKYIESPFRKKGVVTRNQMFSYTIVGSILFIIIGVLGIRSEGWKDRFDTNLLENLSGAKKETFTEDLCVSFIEVAIGGGKFCVLKESADNNILLFGDSHAEALASQVKQQFLSSNFGLIVAVTSACPPVEDVYRADRLEKRACYEQNKSVYSFIRSRKDIKYVILSSRWTLGMEGERFNNQEGGIELGRKPHLDLVSDGEYLLHENYTHRDKISDAYISSVEGLLNAGKKVVLIYPVPEVGWNAPDYIGKYNLIDPDSAYSMEIGSTSYDVFKARNKRAIDSLNKIKKDKNLFRVFPDQLFCDEVSARCIVQKDGIIYYRDDDHLSGEGAKLIIQEMLEFLF